MNYRQLVSRRGLIGLLVVGLLLCLVNVVGARAESTQSDVQNDLENRFSNIPTLDYSGVTYRLKNRITTLLVIGTARETAGIDNGSIRAEFIAMLVVDDKEKTITPVQIDCLTPVLAEGMEAPEAMRTLFSAQAEADQHLSCAALLEGINGLLPTQIMEHYLALDIDALEPYDAVAVVEEGAEETPKAVMTRRLKALMAQAENSSSDELNDLFLSLSDHIVTDMKTGAIMKIIDKADRYEVKPSVYVPGSCVLENEQEVFDVDEEGLIQIVVDTFYEEMIW